MNRIIKFRMWDTRMKRFFMDGGFVDGQLNEELSKWPESFVYQQFTGLIDSNGKEVYEGDIVKYEIWRGPSNQHLGGWIEKQILEIKWFNYGFWTLQRFENIKVIGNIFENPELLN